MHLLSLLASFLLSFQVYSSYICDGDLLQAKIRNNQNGDYIVTSDLETLDKGSFVTLDWQNKHLMLPITFNVGEISFSDKKWLWSYQDTKKGLISDTPRFSERKKNGFIAEHICEIDYSSNISTQ